MKQVETILQDAQLRNTKSRRQLLKLFQAEPHVVSQKQIYQDLAQDFDRATIYRSLKTLIDHQVIHKVFDPSDEEQVNYVLNDQSLALSPAQLREQHLHFKCQKCGNLLCMPEVDIEAFHLPEGYQSLEVNLMVVGICKDCNQL